MTMNLTAGYIYDNAYIKMINSVMEDHANYRIPYLDMIAEFRVRVDNIRTFAVTRGMFDKLGLEEDIFLAKAKLNMIRDVKIMTIEESIGIPCGDDTGLLVITNKYGYCGAGVITIPDIFRSISNEDMYILPSSIHEVLALPDNGNSGVAFLQEMVSEINQGVVEKDERLTDSVYKYFHEGNKIKKVG